MSDIVIHPRYGRGVVKQTRHKDFKLLVAFDDGIPRWVRMDELAEKGILSSTSYVTTVTPNTLPAFSDERFKSRRMIEAFRLGIVPYDCIEEFTFGREKETDILMDWLNNSEESTLLVIGEYGTGKSHLLHYTYGRALQSGFAVAYIEMDPNESPFYKPKQVYSHFVRTLRFRFVQDNQLKGFRDFLKAAIDRGSFENHIYFRHLIGKMSDENLWDWIEASESSIRPWDTDFRNLNYFSLPGLYDYSTAANIYCYLLSALGWAAKEILGLKGLLLIFDEAEVVNRVFSYQIDKGYNFMNALISVANNDSQLLRKPNGISGIGFDYCRTGEGPNIPFIYKQPSGLKLLFAFTNLSPLYRLIGFQTIPRIDLEPLTDAAFKEVFEHICLIYDSAYNFLEEDVTIDHIYREVRFGRSGRTRSLVKGAVEALDLLRLSHGDTSDKVIK